MESMPILLVVSEGDGRELEAGRILQRADRGLRIDNGLIGQIR